MKRHGHLFERVVSFDNLLPASEKALRGQKRKPAAARFFFNLEGELLQLQEELIAGTYQPRPYHVFEIFEPKRRQICAADLRDRVVHHAICNLIEPIFERRAINDSFACRKGKGARRRRPRAAVGAAIRLLSAMRCEQIFRQRGSRGAEAIAAANFEGRAPVAVAGSDH